MLPRPARIPERGVYENTYSLQSHACFIAERLPQPASDSRDLRRYLGSAYKENRSCSSYSEHSVRPDNTFRYLRICGLDRPRLPTDCGGSISRVDFVRAPACYKIMNFDLLAFGDCALMFRCFLKKSGDSAELIVFRRTRLDVAVIF